MTDIAHKWTDLDTSTHYEGRKYHKNAYCGEALMRGRLMHY